MANIKETLEERGTKYGIYAEQCEISKKIKDAMQDLDRFWLMQPDQQDALEMIAVKISRILNGDPDYADNWVDIAGYATLVSNRLLTGEKL